MFVIAIEAVVLRRRLQFSPRQSVEFSMTLNLLSLVVGWLVFFTGLTLLPGGNAFANMERSMIVILFSNGQLPNAFTWVVLAGFGTFVITVLIEMIGFIQLQTFRGEREQIEERYGQRKPRFPTAYKHQKEEEPERKPLSAILVANAASYSLMLVVLFVLQFIYPLENGPLRIIAPFQ